MELETLILPLKSEDNAFRAGISRVMDLVGGLVDFLGDTVKEAMASEDAMAQLNAVIKSTGGVAGVTAKQAEELASAFQATTKFSDEAILSGESMLLTFTSIGKDVFPLATQTMLDMSQALGQDLKSSAIQLGKALNDPKKGITALQRVGVQFNEEQRKMIDNMVESGDLMGAQTLILEELQREFGGSAEAAGKTFGGQLEILKNRVSDLKEGIGMALIPILGELSAQFVDKVLPVLEMASDWFVDTAIPALKKFGKEVGKTFDEEGILGVADMLLDEFDKIDWAGISAGIIKGINSIDWSQVGMDFGALMTRVGESLETAFADFDMMGIGNSLASALNNVIAGALFGTDEAGLQAIIQTKLAEIRTEFEMWAAGMPSSLDTLDQGFITAFETMFATIKSTNQTRLAEIQASFSAWGTSAAATMSAALTNLDLAFVNWSIGVVVKARTWGSNMLATIAAAMNEMQSNIETKLSAITEKFTTRFGSIPRKAAEAFSAGRQALIDVIQSIVDEINKILSKIKTSFSLSFKGLNWNGADAPSTPGTTGGGTGSHPGEGGRASGGPVIGGQTYFAHAQEIFSDGAFTAPTSGRIDPVRGGSNEIELGNATIDKLVERLGLVIPVNTVKAMNSV